VEIRRGSNFLANAFAKILEFSNRHHMTNGAPKLNANILVSSVEVSRFREGAKLGRMRSRGVC
jgi:hypothetical protein